MSGNSLNVFQANFMVSNYEYVAPLIPSSTIYIYTYIYMYICIYIHIFATKLKFSKEAAYNGVT